MTTASETEARATSDNNGTLNELPLLRNERIFGFWGYSSVNIGLSIATWAFLQGGAVAVYVGAKAAVASIVIGYGISVLMVALVPCIPTAKYGIEQWVSLRSVFGQNGARLLMITAVALLAAAWNAVLAIMFGHALRNVSNQVLDTELSSSGTVVSLISLAAVVFVWVVLSRGAISVEWVNRIVAPGLVIVTLGMLTLIFTQTSWSELTAIPPLDPTGDEHVNFMLAVELNMAGGFAWWPHVGNLARLTRSSRSAFWPNMLGLFLTSVVAAVVGAFAALALSSEDPTMWMIPLGGAVLGVIALTFVGFANATSIVSQAYSSLIALKGGGGRVLRRVPWLALAAGVLVPVAILVFFPGAVYENYGRFVSWGAILVAPLCAVQLVDYFVLRRGRLQVRELYRPSNKSRYGFWRGYNPFAFLAIAAGALTYVALLDPVSYAPSGLFGFVTASIPAAVVAGALHYVLTRCVVQRAGRGGYRTTEEDRLDPYGRSDSLG